MKHVLWVLMVVALCAGCATRPASEAHALASDIVRGQSSNVSCGGGDIRYCKVEAGGRKNCACLDYRSLYHRR
jgi:hypothetical protein